MIATPSGYDGFRCVRDSRPLLYGTDSEYYYAILRSAVFDGDADLNNELHFLTPSAAAKRSGGGAGLEFAPDRASGRLCCKYTVGWSIVALPGYLLVRAWDVAFGVPATGYELRYQVAVICNILLAGWLGLMLAYALVRRLTGPWPAAAATVLVLLGSGLFYYTAIAVFMSHGAGFFAVSAFVYLACSIAWGNLNGKGYWLLLGFLAGLMVVTRATNIIYCLFGFYPLLADWKSSHGCGKRLALTVTLGLAGALPLVAAQMLFWLGNFGKPLVFSYGGETFFWSEPRLLSYLFSPRHGLFLYAPVLLLALAGLLLVLGSARSCRPARTPAGLGLLLVIVQIYVNSCWWVWWFGGGFGTRSLVEASPVWILGLGLLLANLKQKARIAVTVVAIAFSIFTVTLLGLSVTHHLPAYYMNIDPKLKGLAPTAPDYFHRVHMID